MQMQNTPAFDLWNRYFAVIYALQVHPIEMSVLSREFACMKIFNSNQFEINQ